MSAAALMLLNMQQAREAALGGICSLGVVLTSKVESLAVLACFASDISSAARQQQDRSGTHVLLRGVGAVHPLWHCK
jgi:hypothetical protein